MWSDAGVTVTVAADVVALLLNVKGIMKATTVVAKWFSRVETAVTVLDLAFQNQDVQNALSSALGDTTAANFMYYWKFASIGVNASVLTKSVLDFKGTAQFFKSFLSKNRSKFHGFLSTDAEKALDDFIEETGKVVDDVGEVVIETRQIDDFIPSSGVQLKGIRNKTTTLLGRWNPDMKIIKNKMLPEEFNVGTSFGNLNENQGGFNFLNIPDEVADASSDFFNEYNKPWLQKAIERNDDILLTTKPIDKSDYFYPNGELIGSYAYELKFLVQNNYKPLNLNNEEWAIIKTWFQ